MSNPRAACDNHGSPFAGSPGLSAPRDAGYTPGDAGAPEGGTGVDRKTTREQSQSLAGRDPLDRRDQSIEGWTVVSRAGPMELVRESSLCSTASCSAACLAASRSAS